MDTRAESNISFFNPNYYQSVFYVERSFNKQVNEFIQQNFLEIIEVFRKQAINFIYLPHLLNNDDYIKVLQYNHPYVNEIEGNGKYISDIYNEIILLFNVDVTDCGLIAVKNNHQSFVDFLNLSLDSYLIEQFENFSKHLNQMRPRIQFLIVDKKADDVDICFSIRPEINDILLNNEYDEEIIEADILRNIEKLHEKGALIVISRIIDKINANSFKISRLLITEDYKLFLKDYNMKLITMSPLEKSIFILYLNHPEGIPFKCLIDFHDELLSIYRNLTNRADVDKAMESIRELTNPLSNSINEKVSRIRAAFITCLTQEIAKNYYITGEKGCPKKITLDRNLIEYQ